MKVVVYTGILLLAVVLICGCTTVSQESGAVTAVIPDITGNWTGTMKAYDEDIGFNDVNGDTITLMVTEQQDRIFSANVIITNESGYYWSNPVAGVIGRDGRTVTLVERGGGSSSGIIISPDEIELIFRYSGEPFSIAIDSLKKS